MERPSSSHVLAILLVVLLAGCVAFLYAENRFSHQKQSTNTLQSSFTPDTTYAVPSHLLLQHSKVGRMHTYEGMVEIPSCDTFSSAVTVQGGSPAQVSIALAVLRKGTVCANTTATTTPFSISFSSSATKAPVLTAITINGKSTPATITEKS